MRALEHTVTGRVYPINEVLEENGVTTLVIQGEHGPFTEPYDVDRFKEMGYKRVTVADDDPRIVGKKV